MSVSPGGSVPDASEKLYGAVPPCALKTWEYAVPAVAFASDFGPRPSCTGSVYAWVTDRAGLEEPVACTVKELVPAALGVPASTPEGVRARPEGSEPEVTENV